MPTIGHSLGAPLEDSSGSSGSSSSTSMSAAIGMTIGFPMGIYVPESDLPGPIVTLISPVAGTLIAPIAPIILTVTDVTAALQRVILFVSQGDNSRAEVAYDGSQFMADYVAGSSVIAIMHGLRFSLIRQNGWKASPTIKVIAYDTEGNENA